MHPVEWFSERPWESALFTTYALSLSFFESVVLHRLRASGCRDIWVIADADGYRTSLAERRSAGVGREYTLIPICLPKGVFHAKCVFLSGAKGSILLVGSGNLTFGGYGRNLEVIEVLSPETSPLAIRDFAEFIESIGRRQDANLPDRSWISRFAALALKSTEGFDQLSTVSQPRLIHSVDRAIVDQIPALCTGRKTKDIHVLSPFHDTDGHAVKTLAEKTQSSCIYIGIPPKKNDVTSFPFPVAKKWSQKVYAALPEVGNHKDRQLHAKWIELSFGSETLTITGSINSTSQALCSTNNIELGVLRVANREDKWVSWKNTSIPAHYEPTKFAASGLRNALVVHAHLEKGGLIRGQILSREAVTGLWDATVISPNGNSSKFNTQVDQLNCFAAQLHWDGKYGLSSSLQISMTLGNREARGWVHVQEYLNLTHHVRKILGTLVRLASGDETEDDYIALLEYLANSTARDLVAFRRRILIESNDSAEIDKDTVGNHKVRAIIFVNLRELEPGTEFSSHDEGRALESLDSMELLDRWFANLRKRLLNGERLGQPRRVLRKVGATAVASAGSDEEEEDGDNEDLRHQERMDTALLSFDRHMKSLLADEKVKANEGASGQVLVTWLEVKVAMLLERFGERSSGIKFVTDWFREACDSQRLKDEETALEQHIFTIAALLPNLGNSPDHPSVGLPQIHDLLEKFCGGDVPETRAHSALLTGRGVGIAMLLVEGETPDLASNLKKVLRTPTLRQEILHLLQAAEMGQPLPISSSVFQCEDGGAFRKALESTAGRKSIDIIRNDWEMCPHKYYKLKDEVLRRLKDDRIAVCNWCERLMVRVTA